ncbi:MAG: tRNA (adenosine(37)-N6)-dimethylallyltransferase MiaA [Phycisphaerae bacterium]|nr:tRNA (adenosine(37)-N6)-dimethylallyltransferase MiaA [Phycisphaerae bacterium]
MRGRDDSERGTGYFPAVSITPPTFDRPELLLLGPTAGGKTAVAVELARRWPGGGECIIADSMQVYEGMVIGTAQPTSEEQAGIPHHLCGTVDPGGSPFTVKDWLEAARIAASEIRGRGRLPILVGGTNLYARSWLEGVFEGPPRDQALRDRLEGEALPELVRMLRDVDPEAAERIHPNDRRRMIRAIEVHASTGRPLSAQQSQWGAVIEGRQEVRVVVLDWPTEILNQRINARVRAMMESGFLEEVRRLAEEGALGPQAIEAVGYRELLEHASGGLGLDAAVERIKIRTRRYGKQQRTWLRRFMAMPGVVRIEPAERSAADIAGEIMVKVQV